MVAFDLQAGVEVSWGIPFAMGYKQPEVFHHSDLRTPAVDLQGTR